MIRLLIKSAFYLVLIFVVISFFVTEPNSHNTSEPNSNSSSAPETTDTTTSDAITALKGAINDLQTFCKRNAEACKIGKSFLDSIGVRARDGARTAYEYLDSTFGNKNMTQSGNASP